RSTLGSLVHALVSESGKSEAQLLNELENIWEKLPFDAQWYADNEQVRHLEMLATFLRWRANTRGQLTEIGTEVDVDGLVGGG
ncbi:hypothetical protein C6A85_12205, partial [Mycobacterium sp. ITM-2017-0098]